MRQKMARRGRAILGGAICSLSADRRYTLARSQLGHWRSDSAARHVAVANGHFRVAQKQAVNGREQATEQAGGGRERDGGGLGHGRTFELLKRCLIQLSGMDLRIPDARCNRLVCMAAIYIVHCNMVR